MPYNQLLLNLTSVSVSLCRCQPVWVSACEGVSLCGCEPERVSAWAGVSLCGCYSGSWTATGTRFDILIEGDSQGKKPVTVNLREKGKIQEEEENG